MRVDVKLTWSPSPVEWGTDDVLSTLIAPGNEGVGDVGEILTLKSEF